MTPLEEAKARMADPTLFPQALKRMEGISARLESSSLNELAKLIQSPIPKTVKLVLVRKATDLLGEAVRGYVPCKDGCSHCCHMATNITLDEAKTIAMATGRPISPDAIMDDADTVEKYNAVPCTFLVGNRCSIYAVRPMACRIHYSVDRDNLLCRIIPGEPIRTPTVDVGKFNLLYALALGIENAHYADIREFFP